MVIHQAHTHPAKISLTFPTSHMTTPPIFLYIYRTSRTLLSKKNFPYQRKAVQKHIFHTPRKRKRLLLLQLVRNRAKITSNLFSHITVLVNEPKILAIGAWTWVIIFWVSYIFFSYNITYVCFLLLV